MRKPVYVLLAVLACSGIAFAAGGSNTPSDKPPLKPLGGRFIVSFEPTASPWARTYREKMVKENIIPTVLQEVSSEVRLPKNVPVTFKDCGYANAFWDREADAMTFCFELIEVMHKVYPAQAEQIPLLRQAGHNTVLKGTILFVLFHELGHGFVNMFDLPITGREEDAVDQFSALLLLSTDPAGSSEVGTGMGVYVLYGALFFDAIATEATELSRSDFADEHSLGQQRYYDLMCLMVGSNMDAYGPMIAPGLLAALPEIVAQPDITPEEAREILAKYDDQNALPSARAVRCEDEYAKIKRSWDVLLETFVPRR